MFFHTLSKTFTAMSLAALIFGCSKSSPSPIDAELAYQTAAGTILGQEMATRHKGDRCVILKAPDIKTSSGRNVENALVNGLKHGIAKDMDIVAELELPMQPAQPTQPDKTPVDQNIQDAVDIPIGVPAPKDLAEPLSRLLAMGGEYDILLVCTPLPTGALDKDGTPLLPALKGKRIVLAAGYRPNYAATVANGTLDAALTVKDDAIFDSKPCPDNLQDAFDKRYKLILPASGQDASPTLEAKP